MKKQLLTFLFAATAATALAQVTDTGNNVGIGNAAPASKLDVNGSINLSLGSQLTIGGIRTVATNGTQNVFMGFQSGVAVTTGQRNALIGHQAGRVLTTGSNNTFFGYRTGYGTTSGDDNIFMGNTAGFTNTTGFGNMFIGYRAGFFNTTGVSNMFLGYSAGQGNTTGASNVAIGKNAGFVSTTGNDNAYIGRDAGSNSTTGSSNTFLGRSAGLSNTTGGNNTYIGSGADGSAALTGSTAIGFNASVTQNNSVVIGTAITNMGVGISAPTQKLHVAGSARITGAILDSNNDPGTAGQVLSSTVAGTDWVAASGSVGPTGPTGAAGVAGPQGPTGATGPLVAGTFGQTLRNDGSTWVSESNLYSDGINVGVGTSTPAQKLHVEGDARISNLNGTGYRTVFADELGNLVTVLPIAPYGEGLNMDTVAIPDNNCAGAISTITLSGLPTAMATSSISVTVNMTHPALGGVSIFLITPDGSVLNLFRNLGYLGSNHEMEFNDAGAILSGGANAQGTFKPFAYMNPVCGLQATVSSFLALGGPIVFGQGSSNFNPNGIWTLKVFDTANPLLTEQTLNSWEITLDPDVPAEGVWSITGNGGTVPSNFIGTTDDQALRFKVNNQRSGILATDGNVALGINALPQITFGAGLVAIGMSALRVNTIGDNNTAIGNKTLYSNVSGNSNTAIGNSALYSNTNGTLNTANGAQSLYNNTTGINNTAIGAYSLYSTTSGSQNTATGSSALQANTTGHENTASGYYALYANTTGFSNTSTGNKSLQDNTTGSYNTAHGDLVLGHNTTGFNNTAIGNSALLANIDGYYNTASGSSSLRNNTSGYENTATGMFSLNGNTAGYSNTGVGFYALHANTTGDYNTAIGYYAQNNITTGNNNTAIGRSANSVGTTQSNSTGLGFDADPTASNTVNVGNSSVTSIKGQVGFTAISDQRFKKNIKDNEVKGLEFITKLRPVTYNFDIEAQARWKETNYGEVDTINWEGKYDIEKIRFSGFLAQEVEATAKSIGYEFSGVDAPKNDKDVYGLRYAEFVVPLVKAVQEQQQQLEQLKPENTVSKEEFDALKAEKDAEIADLKNQMAQILSRLNAFDTDLQSCCFDHSAATGTSGVNQQSTIDNAKLEQNIPNPFRENTTIKYYLPTDSRIATITISDMNGGQLKQFDLQGKGFGQVLISGGSFAAGTYVYTLTVNGKQVDSKRMMLL